MSQFIRHPLDVPLAYQVKGSPFVPKRFQDSGAGGLRFRGHRPVPTGCEIRIAIDAGEQQLEADGVVIWCRRVGTDYDLGMCFRTPDTAFAVRMAEQLCHIEHYRRQLARRGGRWLSREQAAEEWIARHAADFPPLEAAG